jgi:membrane protease YdiL (CAAX protease family)
LVNLFFTCVAEEALFRGFLQNQLTQLLSQWTYGSTISLILTSILFGLVHFPGGWSYVFLATVAGLFYGYAYFKAQKIEASIWVHFLVNAIHFLAFTYPALKGPI